MATKMMMIMRSHSAFFRFNCRGKQLTPFPYSAHTTFFASLIHSNSASADYEKHPKSIYQKVSNLDDALYLFNQMSQRRPFPSIIYFTQLLHSLTKMKHYSHSVDMFKQMCALRVPFNNYTINIVIKCFCQLHRTTDGFAVLGFCFRRGISPDVFTFNTLLNGLVGEERILEAEYFFKKLIKDKLCEPDVVTYNTMIKGLCKVGNNVIATQLLRLMDDRGCKPNVVTYNNIIDSLCKDQMIDDAFKLFKKMVFQQGISPDVITYSSLIDGLCKLGHWEEASKMIKEMLDVGISLDVQAFNILVDAFCKEGKTEEAEDVVDLMLDKRIVPDIVTYNSLIDGYCLRGEMSKARTVFDSMVLRDIVPNVVTYNSLLNGYCKSLKIDEAMLLFQEMNEKGPKPNVVTYNTMLWGLFRVGNCGAARKFFDEMCAKGLEPHECAGKCGKLDICKVLFQDLTNKGLHPDVQTYNVMISGFCRGGLLLDAKQFFQEMEESGFPPDNVTYHVLLKGCLNNQQYDDIEMLLQEMDVRGYSLDASTLSLLLDRIAAGSLNTTLSNLIGKLVPKELIDSHC